MNYFQAKVGKVNKSSGLSTVKGLWGVGVSEVFVVGKDLNWEWQPMEIMSAGFQGADDSKEFPVVDVIVMLSREKQLGKVGTGVPISI